MNKILVSLFAGLLLLGIACSSSTNSPVTTTTANHTQTTETFPTTTTLVARVYVPKSLPRNGWTDIIATQLYPYFNQGGNDNYFRCGFDYIIDHYTPTEMVNLSMNDATVAGHSAGFACIEWMRAV